MKNKYIVSIVTIVSIEIKILENNFNTESSILKFKFDPIIAPIKDIGINPFTILTFIFPDFPYFIALANEAKDFPNLFVPMAMFISKPT